MLWHAMPPEINTARLMAGAGPAPMLQAAAGWRALGVALDAQAGQLAASLTALAGSWAGAGSEQAVAAALPAVSWLQTVATQAHKRAAQAAAQAAAYSTALAMTPSLPEIATNHVTRAVLAATNFLGINLVPIGIKETDYFVRMWNQAAAAMDVYQTETAINSTFEPLPPAKPIVIPGAGQVAEAATMAQLVEMGTKLADPGAFLRVTTELATSTPLREAPLRERIGQFTGQLGQLSGSMSQLVQMGTTMAGADRAGLDAPQTGLLGASPLSTHPLAGGSGPSSGAGLLRGDSLPGAGGSSSRTPMMAHLLDKSVPSVAPAAVTTATAAGHAAAAGSSAVGSAAPLGTLGAMGAHSGTAKSGPAAPALLTAESDETRDEDDDDDW